MNLPKHRHERSSWLIAGGNIEWCYCCGAWRQMRHIDAGAVTPSGSWHKPSGDPKDNPAMHEDFKPK